MRASAVARLEARLSELAGAPVGLERPNDPEHGDYATNVAMQLAPVRKRSPRELGEELASAALGLVEVERAEVAGPGFVNLWLAPSWFGEALAEMLEAGDAYGGGSAERPDKVQVEMVSANPTGPITVASARNGAIGDAVARLFVFAGHAGPGSTYTPITIVHATVAPGATLTLPWRPDFNALVYALSGDGAVGTERAERDGVAGGYSEGLRGCGRVFRIQLVFFLHLAKEVGRGVHTL